MPGLEHRMPPRPAAHAIVLSRPQILAAVALIVMLLASLVAWGWAYHAVTFIDGPDRVTASHDRVYIQSDGIVLELDHDGTLIARHDLGALGIDRQITGMHALDDETLVVATPWDGRVYHCDLSAPRCERLGPTKDHQLTWRVRLTTVDDTIYVAQSHDKALFTIALPSGGAAQRYLPGLSLDEPVDLAADGRGALYIASADSATITVLLPDGERVERDGVADPVAVSSDRHGQPWVLGRTAGGHASLRRISGHDSTAGLDSPITVPELGDAADLAWTDDGAVLVDPVHFNALRIDPETHASTPFGDPAARAALDAMGDERERGALIGGLAIATLALSIIGIFGLIVFIVSRRKGPRGGARVGERAAGTAAGTDDVRQPPYRPITARTPVTWLAARPEPNVMRRLRTMLLVLLAVLVLAGWFALEIMTGDSTFILFLIAFASVPGLLAFHVQRSALTVRIGSDGDRLYFDNGRDVRSARPEDAYYDGYTVAGDAAICPLYDIKQAPRFDVDRFNDVIAPLLARARPARNAALMVAMSSRNVLGAILIVVALLSPLIFTLFAL